MKHFSALMLLIFTAPFITAASQSPKDIFEAAEVGNIEAVRAFIEGGTQVNTIDSYGGDTPLHFAAYYGHIAVAQLLIEKGAQVNAADSSDDTPLHWAANNGHAAVAQLLGKIKALLDAIKKHDVHAIDTTDMEWFCEQALAYALKEQEKGRSENTDAIVQMLSTAATKHLCSQRENVIAQVCRNNHTTSSIWHLLAMRQLGIVFPPAQRRRLDQPAPLTPSVAGPASAAATVSKL